jgi:pimeloyl-ACP methyl ester carboxylesterase
MEAPTLRLRDLDTPTLLLVGELDHPDVRRRVRFLAENIRGARVATIPAAGHAAPIENPDAVARELRAFLEILAPAAPAGRRVAVSAVTLSAEDGVRLAANYYAPDAAGPGVLLLHMCMDGVDDSSWHSLARRLASSGLHTLTLDFRGYGQSEGKRPEFSGMESFMAHLRSQLARDVDAGVAFLRSRDGVLADSLGIGGASCGLPLGVEAASRYPSVRALALLSGPLDAAAQERLAGLKDVPVLVAASEGDARSFEAAKRVFATAPHPASVSLQFKGETHGTAIFQREPGLERTVVQWLRRWLQP